MDEDQLFAQNLILNGHNLCLTGQAGTGKSFVIKETVKLLRHNGFKVALTCSTGIGTRVYGNEKASTLHKWAGIQDGRFDNAEALNLIINDEKYESIKNDIKTTQYLFVDEVSMISRKILSQVEFICRNVRNNGLYFGGLVVILSGDFWQLPPVRNELYGDFGQHCLTVKWFNDVFPHRVNLSIIHRQTDQMLITAVNELEKGKPSDSTIAFVQSLSRPLPEHLAEKSVHLFARNLDVDLFNYNKLQNLPGELFIFQSEDTGDSHYLNKCLAPKHLGLKVGCPVMLLINLSEDLVNGSIGTVKSITREIFVEFVANGKVKTVPISKYVFSTYDPVNKNILAKRSQFPLKLAYAVTIHKSQGMSLDSVTVDCKNATNPGQIGVAVGRVKTVEGLLVKNFVPSLCKPHPKAVENYYASCTVGEILDNKNCCKINFDSCSDEASQETFPENNSDDSDDTKSDSENTNDGSDLSDFEPELLQVIDELEVPNHINTLTNHIVTEFSGTQLMQSAATFKSETVKNVDYFSQWVDKQVRKIDDISKNVFPQDKLVFAAKNFHAFYSDIHSYLSSNEYRDTTSDLCKRYSSICEDDTFKYCTTILFFLQKQKLEEIDSRTKKETSSILKTIPTETELTAPARGKIRYISGYVIAKLKYRASLRLRSSLFAKGKEETVEYNQNVLNLLDPLCVTYDEISQCTTDTESLHETQRKQNLSEGLCNVNDETFNFFMKLEKITRELLTYENLQEKKSEMYMFVLNILLQSDELKRYFFKLASGFMHGSHNVEDQDCEQNFYKEGCSDCSVIQSVYRNVISLFVKVSVAQFRKKFLAALKVEKSKALRKKVMQKSQSKSKLFNMEFIKSDCSENKQISHLRLKSELLQSDDKVEKTFLKDQLLMLCTAYNVKVSKSKTKAEILKELKNSILNSDSMPNSNVISTVIDTSTEQSVGPIRTVNVQLDEEQPGPSGCVTGVHQSDSVVLDKIGKQKRKISTGMTGKDKGKGKGKGKRIKSDAEVEDDSQNCSICNKKCMDNEDWISCDICNLLCHKTCANLEDEHFWLYKTAGNQEYHCPFCL